MIKKPHKIVISRTDSIGDVVLTLPMAGIIKAHFPDVHLIFLGNTYTKPIIECNKYVDEIWEWATLAKQNSAAQVAWLTRQNVDVFIHVFPNKQIARLAKKAKIKHRIGTSHRAFHWLTCNHKPNFTRKKSNLHEAQLNIKLLAPLGITHLFSLAELTNKVGFSKIPELPSQFRALLSTTKRKVIMHCKSQGSAVEWGVDKFITLAKELDPAKFELFFTGTEKEASFFRNKLPKQQNIHDLAGKMTLHDLVAFIAASDILVAASTGPLHIAGVSNCCAIGLFSCVRPIHAGRWKPLGKQVVILEDKKSEDTTQPLQIEIREVKKAIENCGNK